MEQGADNLSLGPAKSNLGYKAAKADWLIKNYRHDEGSVTLQPSMTDQSRSVADRLYRWLEAEHKRRPANRPYPENDGLL